MGKSQIRMVDYGHGLLDPQVIFPHGNSFSIIPVLRLGKSQVTTVGILPNKRSQSARYCLVWGIRLVYGSTIVGQATVKMLYRLRPSPPFRCIFYFYIYV